MHIIVLHYHICDMFRLVLSHHQGDKYKGPYICEYSIQLGAGIAQ